MQVTVVNSVGIILEKTLYPFLVHGFTFVRLLLEIFQKSQ